MPDSRSGRFPTEPSARRFGLSDDPGRRLKGEQAFIRLKAVRGETTNGRKVVDPDGVPDGTCSRC